VIDDGNASRYSTSAPVTGLMDFSDWAQKRRRREGIIYRASPGGRAIASLRGTNSYPILGPVIPRAAWAIPTASYRSLY